MLSGKVSKIYVLWACFMFMELEKNNARVIEGWAMYDWANSAYNLVITSTIFPAYYTIITTTGEHGDKVSFFGYTFVNTALSNYALCVAYLLMVVLLPLLSSAADYHGQKKRFMKFFTTLGAFACMGMFFFKLDTLEWGVICFAIAAMGYIGGVMFANSYLPEIASVDQQDRVSAKGFSYGYVGSVVLQIVCFVFVLKPEWFGIIDGSFPARLSFLLTGIWWLGFAQITFRRLPEAKPVEKQGVKNGYQELLLVFHRIQAIPFLKRFLFSFFLYSVGVQTVMLVAAAFGEKVLHLGTSKLIGVILIIQLVAIIGANVMSRLAAVFGNIRVLMGAVLIWIAVCFAAWALSSEMQFYIIAVVVGMIMGGIQSLSRSTYSKALPQDLTETASFFSFYDVTEKLAIVIGLATFAFVEEHSNIRNSALFLSVFFVLGFVALFFVLKKE